ncbi:hypothetical protein A2165_04625 [Candidatus Curtissbacteria bacterium RBG_13_40_7]|uniref:HYDIN/VesB/CFA65-like Ig-like domain-containing protein n=1 Tax=Candidatus Curtissbacteria bacterium RBG_13_40_7 TaxID=1797706 RepID=A0A1F5FYZ0_9BACT|nr:MAG: hypothetical protein A2165_04625 [Candidatus Curtissbacteria bacterium RBG_13_40_7]
MKRIDPFILGIIIFLGVVLVGGVVFAYKSGRKPMETYSATDQNRPQVELQTNLIDLGEMKVSDIKSADFTVKNIGNKPLQINNISTSCDCTFAQVIIGDQVSPRFTMHQNPKWTGEIQPGQEAKVTATYEPTRMPVKGKVERSVHVKTNDPQNPDIALTVVATVN